MQHVFTGHPIELLIVVVVVVAAATVAVEINDKA